MSDLLQILKENTEISCKSYNALYSLGSRPKHFYGLNKSYNLVIENIPFFRPTLSATDDTPIYKLANFVVFLIEPLTNNQYTMKYPFSFSEDIENFY